jgi:hypothetical protein
MSSGTLPLDEPWDPAALLADPTLGRACYQTRCEKRVMATITIHGEKFTGNPRDWKDAKTEIGTAIANAGCTFVMDAGTTLFQLAGSGDHSDVGDVPGPAHTTGKKVHGHGGY